MSDWSTAVGFELIELNESRIRGTTQHEQGCLEGVTRRTSIDVTADGRDLDRNRRGSHDTELDR